MLSTQRPKRRSRLDYASCKVKPEDVSQVVSHRLRNGEEQYLIKWKRDATGSQSEAVAVYSWHVVPELSWCLHLVQKYIDSQYASRALKGRRELPSQSTNKRKRTGSEVERSHGVATGLPSPLPSSRSSASPSVWEPPSPAALSEEPDVYNGILVRKEGQIVARTNEKLKNATSLGTKLPNAEMIEEAAVSPMNQGEEAILAQFKQKIKKVPYLQLENQIDGSAPSLEFEFIHHYRLQKGIYRAPESTYEGCQEPCRPNMGQFIGCEYTTKCKCLEYAAVDEESLRKKAPERYEEYMAAMHAGGTVNTLGLPKRFPYMKPSREDRPSTLQAFYRESRHPIYECNANCNCGDVCKSRLVQKGRQVPLTIFKTDNRGWGVYCNEDLVQGEFIDTYLGEVITNEEADRREEKAGKDKSSYMYNLDKFVGDTPTLTSDTCYVVDGQYMGGVTRFINHSCEPNCRQYTVSYNRHDLLIYELAFFAYEDIEAGTELTFDYLDKDEQEEEDVLRARELAASDPNQKDRVKCNCGARKCRGYLWV